jgi:hypothetical protein
LGFSLQVLFGLREQLVDLGQRLLQPLERLAQQLACLFGRRPWSIPVRATPDERSSPVIEAG